MNALLLTVLGIQAIVFLAFVILAFRWLFALRQDAVNRSGSTVPGPRPTLAAFRDGFFDPRYSWLRWGIVICVLVLLASAIAVPNLTQA